MCKIKGNGSKSRVGGPRSTTWKLTVSLGRDPITGKYPRRTKTVKGSERVAARELESYIQEIELGLPRDAYTITVEQYAEKWMREREQSGQFQDSTLERNRDIIKYIVRYLGNLPLMSLESQMVEQFYLKMNKDNVSIPTANKASVVLNQIVQSAVRQNILKCNPCRDVKKPPQQKSVNRRSLTKEELQNLEVCLEELKQEALAAIESEPRYMARQLPKVVAIKIAMRTGMRRGELLALTWSNLFVDTERAEIKVKHSLTKKMKIKATKTFSGVRTIIIDNALAAELSDWKTLQANYLKKIGNVQSGDTPIVCNEKGSFLNSDNFYHWWVRFLESKNCASITIHELRHTHASILVSNNLNYVAISKRLGHASVSTTMNLYCHGMQEDDKKAAAMIAGIIAGDGATTSDASDKEQDQVA